MFHFYEICLNLFNISSLFSGGIIISLTFFEFLSNTGFYFTILSTILLPINLSVVSAALWATFLEAAVKAASPLSNNCFLFFLQMTKMLII